MSVAELLGRLATREGRADAARALAVALGGRDLLLFVRDAELGTLRPAPGFTQTIPRGAVWRGFLDRCLVDGECDGTMPTSAGAAESAWGVKLVGDAVLVLPGGTPDRAQLRGLLPLFPLLVALAQSEEAVRAGAVTAELATAAMGKSEILARALESSRDHLRDALEAARAARKLIEKQAEELEVTATELSESKEELETSNEELMRLNAELQRTTEDAKLARGHAEEANLAKSTFLARMSHELRTPLNAIGGFASLLVEGIMGELTAGQLQYLGRIKRSQAHLLSLINDVLNFAKVESGTIVYNIAPLPLVQVLASTAPLIETMAAAHDVAYEYRPPSAEVRVAGDRDKIVQIVLNLLTNAVKFTPSGGRVEMSVESTDGEASVIVRDTGAGVPVDRQTSIFEPFVQLERSFGVEREGVGLGLAISRELARAMRGDITVQSAAGKGSSFTLTLPLDDGART